MNTTYFLTQIYAEQQNTLCSCIKTWLSKEAASGTDWIFVCMDLSLGFYFVPLIYISVFVPVPYFLDDCRFVVQSEVWLIDSSSFILTLVQVALGQEKSMSSFTQGKPHKVCPHLIPESYRAVSILYHIKDQNHSPFSFP